MTAKERFASKVIKAPSGCWEYTGGINSGGYGNFWYEGKTVSAHRFSFIEHKGAIPDSLTLDHTCRNRKCVNPDHLEPVTDKENILRGTAPSALNKAKTHCIRGHELNPENTLLEKDGHRQCRICRRATWRSFARRKRGLPC